MLRPAALKAHGTQEEAQQPPAQQVKVIPRYGIAIFDNPKEIGCGWACASDGEPMRINSATDLDTSTIWVTSLDWGGYFANRGQSMHHVRRTEYLRSSLTQIAVDVGTRAVGAYAPNASKTLSRIVQQAVIIAANLYGWEDPSTELRGDVLGDDIRRHLASPPKAPRHLQSPLLQAFQSYSAPCWPRSFVPETLSVTLRHNRLEYAKTILDTLVPDGAWTYFGVDRAEHLTVERLTDPQYPSLVEASVELSAIDPDIATLIAYGAQVGNRATGVRRWISQPELIWLLRHARVHITAAYVSKGTMPLPEAAKLPSALTGDPLFEASVSAGLVAESHWQALANKGPARMGGSAEVSSWAVWLRAADRAFSFAQALKAYKAGFAVYGYGNGSVLLRLQRDQLPRLLGFAEDNGFAHPVFQPLFEEHGFV